MTNPASASEDAERLYSRGLVELNAGRPTAALSFFERAVQSDPSDPYAQYYRGVARRHLGNLQGAIADFRAVRERQANFTEAAIELGTALIETGAFTEAIAPLQEAQSDPELTGAASLYLGVAQLRLERFDSARASFARAAAEPKVRLMARYYQGVINYRQGRWVEAREDFVFVSESAPHSDVGREAETFITLIRQGRSDRWYGFTGSVRLQYDSNVVLAPTSGQVKNDLLISNQADGSASLQAGAFVVPWQNSRMQLQLGYDFFQRLYFDLTEFNLQDHRPTIQLTYDATVVQLGLLGQYDYYLRKTASFLQDVAVLPWVSIPVGTFGRTEIFYRMLRNAFLQQPYKNFNSAFNHAAGIRQLVYLGAVDQYVWGGYLFDAEDPSKSEGEVFAYDGNSGVVGISWAFPKRINGEVSYAFSHQDYASASDGRRDNQHQVTVQGRIPLTWYLDLVAGYAGIINDSNQAPFEYDRHIGTIAVEVSY